MGNGEGNRRISIKKARGKAAEDLLKIEIEKAIKGVFTSCLEAIEIRFGDDFEGYRNLRARVLRVGNDAIRDIKDSVDDKYTVERQSESLQYDADKGTVEYQRGGKDVGKEAI